MSYRQSVKTITCPTCGSPPGKSCIFEYVSYSGTFHKSRIEAYRQTPRYKENFRKKMLHIRTDPIKIKRAKKKGDGRTSYKISGNCSHGKHTQCYNRYCPCPCHPKLSLK